MVEAGIHPDAILVVVRSLKTVTVHQLAID